jgi:hypothetical protein
MVDQEHAVDGKEVTVLWGEPDGEPARENIDNHVQTTIRATISTRSPIL